MISGSKDGSNQAAAPSSDLVDLIRNPSTTLRGRSKLKEKESARSPSCPLPSERDKSPFPSAQPRRLNFDQTVEPKKRRRREALHLALLDPSCLQPYPEIIAVFKKIYTLPAFVACQRKGAQSVYREQKDFLRYFKEYLEYFAKDLLQKMQTVLDEANAARKDLLAQLQKICAEHEAALAETPADKEKLNQTCLQHLQAVIIPQFIKSEGMSQQIQDLSSRLTKAEAGLEQAKVLSANIQNVLDQSISNNANISAELKKSQEAAKTVEKISSQLEKINRQQQEQKRAHEEKEQALYLSMDRLRTEICAAQQETERLNQLIAEEKRRYLALEEESKAVETTRKEYFAKVETLYLSMDRLRTEICAAQQETERLNQLIAEEKRRYLALEEESKAVEKTCEEYFANIEKILQDNGIDIKKNLDNQGAATSRCLETPRKRSTGESFKSPIPQRAEALFFSLQGHFEATQAQVAECKKLDTTTGQPDAQQLAEIAAPSKEQSQLTDFFNHLDNSKWTKSTAVLGLLLLAGAVISGAVVVGYIPVSVPAAFIAPHLPAYISLAVAQDLISKACLVATGIFGTGSVVSGYTFFSSCCEKSMVRQYEDFKQQLAPVLSRR